MPRFERPENSSLPDFGEFEAAAVWGQNDELEDMSVTDRQYEGFYIPGPQAPQIGQGPLYDSPKAILGSKNPDYIDTYYESKMSEGLIEGTEFPNG